MTPLIFSMPGNEAAGHALATALHSDLGLCEIRRFADGESYVRLGTPVAGHPVILVCTLDRPDEKILPLAFLAATARDLGAGSVGLICPYLPYMRQDKRFHAGEAVGARLFAEFLGKTFDWLVTVDPHLHRLHSLKDVLDIPAVVVNAAPALSEWIQAHVPNPVLVGPDSESEQWVAAIAAAVGAPYTIMQKVRRGDHDVTVTLSEAMVDPDRTPVITDDIISTAGTMIAAVHCLRAAGSKPPVCVGVHAIFAGNAYAALRDAGVTEIVTCNTIGHISNGIDLMPIISDAARTLLSSPDYDRIVARSGRGPSVTSSRG